MTFEQVLAKLDEIAAKVATVEQCGLCHRSYLRNELNEAGPHGARVCPKCAGRMASAVPTRTKHRIVWRAIASDWRDEGLHC